MKYTVKPEPTNSMASLNERREKNHKIIHFPPAEAKQLDSCTPEAIKWSLEDVLKWLSEEMKFPQYVEAFRANYIHGRRLVRINANSLPKIGITNWNHIKEITAGIRQLLSIDYPGTPTCFSKPNQPLEMYLEHVSRSGVNNQALQYSRYYAANRQHFEDGIDSSRKQYRIIIANKPENRKIRPVTPTKLKKEELRFDVTSFSNLPTFVRQYKKEYKTDSSESFLVQGLEGQRNMSSADVVISSSSDGTGSNRISQEVSSNSFHTSFEQSSHTVISERDLSKHAASVISTLFKQMGNKCQVELQNRYGSNRSFSSNNVHGTNEHQSTERFSEQDLQDIAAAIVSEVYRDSQQFIHDELHTSSSLSVPEQATIESKSNVLRVITSKHDGQMEMPGDNQEEMRQRKSERKGSERQEQISANGITSSLLHPANGSFQYSKANMPRLVSPKDHTDTNHEENPHKGNSDTRKASLQKQRKKSSQLLVPENEFM